MMVEQGQRGRLEKAGGLGKKEKGGLKRPKR